MESAERHTWHVVSAKEIITIILKLIPINLDYH